MLDYSDYLNRLNEQGGGGVGLKRFDLLTYLFGPPPDICGGGAFFFGGLQAEKGGAQGFFGGLLEYDSRTGWSLNGLFELGKKGGSGGGAIANPDQTEGLAFIPLVEREVEGVPVEGGALGTTSGAVGAYAEAGHGNVGVGVGGYIELARVGGCSR